MLIRFNCSVQTPCGLSFDKDTVVERSAIPGRYFASWLASGICVEEVESLPLFEVTTEETTSEGIDL